MDAEKQLELLKRGTVRILEERELLDKLRRSEKGKRPLRVKLGIDPTAPDIHLGFTVVLTKLRQFQELRHQAVLIIGDFTAQIGDPSGEDKTRPELAPEVIAKNAETYLAQAGKILDLGRAEVVRNSSWLGTLALPDFLRLARSATVARILERDDFSERYRKGIPIALHEFLYPLLQGYDSIAVKADVELGGTDQTFNLLAGRDLQRAYGQEPQVVLTTPLLVGLDGAHKMSKSLGNTIGVAEPPFEMYSKVMSIPDGLMRDYFVLTTDVEASRIERLLSSAVSPRNAKRELASALVSRYHGAGLAGKAAARWDEIFSRRETPKEMSDLAIPRDALRDGKVWVVKLVTLTGLTRSNGEARRLIEQGAVSLDDTKLTDPEGDVVPREGAVLRIGKKMRFFRLVVG